MLASYRRVSAICAALAGAALLVNAAALVVSATGHGRLVWFSAVSAVALAVLLLLWRNGYRTMRKRVARADEESRRVIDSAQRDALTGAYTRSYFLATLNERVHRGSSMPVGYFHVDMDHLKALNDGHGHAAGDAALVHLTATIRRLAPDAVIGRLGGDEFGVALIGQDSKQALTRLAERILEALRQEVKIREHVTRISATVGVALAPDDATNVDELMSRADLALYCGKRSGRSMVVGYDPDMLVDERHNRFVQRELRAALLLNEIKVVYQPVYSIDGMKLKSYEALVRWQHCHRGTIAPSEFIPIAEQSDIIDRLGEVVLRQVCADLKLLGVPIAVNVSPVQLRRPGFAASFAAILDEANISGDRIIVEITENILMKTGGVETENLTALTRFGVKIAIDDFGAGHASLEYLRSFAFNVIKIDRSYVAHLKSGRADRAIISALCDIAQALDIEVIAEGVETQEQLDTLRQIGCDAVQGYLLGRPGSVRALVGNSLAAA